MECLLWRPNFSCKDSVLEHQAIAQNSNCKMEAESAQLILVLMARTPLNQMAKWLLSVNFQTTSTHIFWNVLGFEESWDVGVRIFLLDFNAPIIREFSPPPWNIIMCMHCPFQVRPLLLWKVCKKSSDHEERKVQLSCAESLQITDLYSPIRTAEKMNWDAKVDEESQQFNENWAQPVRHFVFKPPVRVCKEINAVKNERTLQFFVYHIPHQVHIFENTQQFQNSEWLDLRQKHSNQDRGAAFILFW